MSENHSDRPGPYGPPGPYGEQPRVPAQLPVPPLPGYGPSSAPGGGKRKAGLVAGAVALVAAIAVGGYFVIGGGSGGGSAGITDDGPHKLVAADTVLGEYRKTESDSGLMSPTELEDAESWGVQDPKDVVAGYEVKESGALRPEKWLSFAGFYGTIDDPEKAVDAVFAGMEKQMTDDEVTFDFGGDPKEYRPGSLDGAVLKCQKSTAKNPGEEPPEVSMTWCAWADHSTLGLVTPMEYADVMSGRSSDPEEAAEMTARLREELRVRI